jgi:ABC-type glycerol-3-phosphate transport system substrate-binding protein
MIGMPFNSSTPIMYYNVEAFEKAGVTPPKTWEEFQTATAPAAQGSRLHPDGPVAPAVDLHRELLLAPQPAFRHQ